MKKNKPFGELFYRSLKKTLKIMRIAILLMILGILQAHATDAYSQKTRLSLNLSETKLNEVLDKIEEQSDFFFLFNEKLLDTDRKVSISVNDQLINVILDDLFTGTDVKYTIIDKKIILAPEYLNKEPETVAQQQQMVTGKVTDSQTGEPMPGVNIVVKGTTVGTVTSTDGKYSISATDSNATLVFSFIGYVSQEISLNGNKVADVSLLSEVTGLEEVVVIGYGTQKKVNVIGSVVTVNTKEINTAPVSMVSNALAGRMPGAIVQQLRGEPGNNASVILIRGKATLGDNSPLIVVDGIPDRDMNSLQSTDIESITVLKDASAAIYGARAANGVILITTKRGKTDTPASFNYSFYQGMLSPTKLPEMCDAATYAQMIREMQSYRNVDESNMMYSLDDIEKYKSGLYPWTHPNTDWFAEGLRDHSITRSHNLSVSGGSKAITYYGSFGSRYDDGIYTNSASYYKRYNLKVNIDAKVNKYLNVGIDIFGSQENTMFPIGDSKATNNGQAIVFQMLRRSFPTSPAFFPNGLPGPDIESGWNPVVISGFDPGYDDNKIYRINSILSATLNIPGVSGLSLSGYFAYDLFFGARKRFLKPYTLYSLDEQAYLNAGNTGAEDGSAFLIANFPKGQAPEPQVTDYSSNSNNTLFNFRANYDKTIAGVHNISAFISMENSEYFSQGIAAFRRYFISDKLPYLFAGGKTEMDNNGSVSIDSRLNYFGRVMYNYKGTYLVQFSLRRDGSLRFAKERAWGTFPSAMVGWRISNESFWKNNVKFINDLKVKASFGQMGNDRIAPWQYLDSYTFGTGGVFGGVYSLALPAANTPNPYITWERANVFNIGFESMFLNNKVSLNTDFFYQRRSDILVKRNASVPYYSGLTLPDENYGIVDNKGFEIELGYKDLKGNFSYGINGNIAFARNKIIEYDEPVRNVPWQVMTGHPQGSLLLYKSAGIFRDEEQVNALPHVAEARPGDIIIEDYDKNGEINNDDRIIFEKTADPELTFGLIFNLGYKNWNLSCLIQGAGTTLRSVASNKATGSIGNYFAYEAEDRWTVDNIDATKPRAYEREEEYWRRSYETDYNYQKGGYARMKNIQLSYSIPKSLLNKISVKDAQVYFSGENLFLIYSQNKILDPEAGTMETYPIMKIMTIGASITF